MEGKLLFLQIVIASLLSSTEVKFLESKKVNEFNIEPQQNEKFW